MQKLILLLIGAALLVGACSKGDAEIAPGQGVSGSITRFVTYQNYLYGLNLNEVQTYDISDADHPKLIHRLATDYGLETITIYDNTVYLGSTTALYILGIDDPAAPKILSQTPRIDNISGCDPVVVKDNYAYSTVKIIANICGDIATESALLVFDVSNKSVPVPVASYPLNIPNGLGIKGNYLLVCDEGADRLEVFDISDPLAVTNTGWGIALQDPVDLIVNGEKMIVSTKTDFAIYDVSNMAAIRKVGAIAK